MAMSNILLKEVTMGLFLLISYDGSSLFLMMALAYHITSPKVCPRNSKFCSKEVLLMAIIKQFDKRSFA